MGKLKKVLYGDTMKKKFFSAIALMLGLTCFSACTDPDRSITFGRYWQTNATSYQEINEKLEYSITHEKGSGMDNLGYTFEYTNGKYVTELKSAQQDGADIYLYTTTLTMHVTYTYGNEKTTFEDTITTETKFSTDLSLRPLSSKKTIVNHTPRSVKVNALKDCYTYYAYKSETTYEDGKSGETKVIRNFDNPTKKTEETKAFSIGSKYNYLDNEQLPFALRGFSTSDVSASVKVYSPFDKIMQKVDISFSTEEKGQVFPLTVNGTSITGNIPYRVGTFVLDDTYSGEEKTVWIAKPTDVTNNTNRNVILRLETPLAYNFGSLVYNLKTITNS